MLSYLQDLVRIFRFLDKKLCAVSYLLQDLIRFGLIRVLPEVI